MNVFTNIINGQENYEKYFSAIVKKNLYQYEYRHTDGELFSCIKSSLQLCREAKDIWLKRKEENK